MDCDEDVGTRSACVTSEIRISYANPPASSLRFMSLQMAILRQRTAERAQHEEEGDIDMMGQYKALDEFQADDDLGFGLDEYGGC